MSLLDGILLDNLLQTVMLQDVWLANRTDYSASTKAGAGTELDPFQAQGTDADADPPFDQIMRELKTKYPAGVTVRLLPGTYYTRGAHSGYTTSQGWQPFNNLRIAGTSMHSTTIKLCNNLTGDTVAIGCEGTSSPTVAPPFLDSFELSDLTINASSGGSTPSTSAQSCVAVRGRNIYVTRVRATAFGSSGNASGLKCGISLARTLSSAPALAENCIAEGCVVDGPRANGGTLYGFYLSYETGFEHRFCTLRNNYIDLTAINNGTVGVGASGGIGTIIEYNRILNCLHAFELANAANTTDVVFRQNFIRNVEQAVYLSLTGTTDVARVLLHNNYVEWPTTGEVWGVHFTQTGSTAKIRQLVIRENIMRRIDAATPAAAQHGVYLGDNAVWNNLVVDNNLLDVAPTIANGVSHPPLPTGATVTLFNNRKTDNTFLPGHIRTTAFIDQELTTDVETLIIGL